MLLIFKSALHESSAGLPETFTNPTGNGTSVILSAAATPITTTSNLEYPVTIVTAYFKLKKSKFTHGHYQNWMKNFMTSVTAPVIFFTTHDDEPNLRSLRGTLPASYVSYPDLWDVPAASVYKDIFVSQHSIDPEQKIHSPELYAIWNLKAWFTAAAAAQNPYNSTYFMWVDVGSFRNRAFSSWPHIGSVEKAFLNCHNCVILSQIAAGGASRQIDAKNKKPLVGDLMQGGFFAGTRESMLWWCVDFFDFLEDSARLGHFVGKDQTLINKLTIQNYWRVRWIASYRSNGCGPDVWFAFQHMFAIPSESCPLLLEGFDGNITVHNSSTT
jgi:hypothetical protein